MYQSSLLPLLFSSRLAAILKKKIIWKKQADKGSAILVNVKYKK